MRHMDATYASETIVNWGSLHESEFESRNRSCWDSASSCWVSIQLSHFLGRSPALVFARSAARVCNSFDGNEITNHMFRKQKIAMEMAFLGRLRSRESNTVMYLTTRKKTKTLFPVRWTDRIRMNDYLDPLCFVTRVPVLPVLKPNLATSISTTQFSQAPYIPRQYSLPRRSQPNTGTIATFHIYHQPVFSRTSH